MELHTFQAEARTATGKGVARKARFAGRIPAVVYGQGEPAALTIDPVELRRLKTQPLGWNTPLTLAIEGGDNVAAAMLVDVQRHPVSGKLLHADFKRVDTKAEVKVLVPVETEGKALGLAQGGRVSLAIREVEVVCALGAIPSVVVVDVSALDINDKIFLQDLPLPNGCRVASNHNPSVVACVGKRGAKLDEDGEEEAEADAEAEGEE